MLVILVSELIVVSECLHDYLLAFALEAFDDLSVTALLKLVSLS